MLKLSAGEDTNGREQAISQIEETEGEKVLREFVGRRMQIFYSHKTVDSFGVIKLYEYYRLFTSELSEIFFTYMEELPEQYGPNYIPEPLHQHEKDEYEEEKETVE